MKDPNKVKAIARKRKKRRIRKKIAGTAERPRLVVYRSLAHIYAQLVDDSEGRTLVALSSLSKRPTDEIKKAKSRREISNIVGRGLAKIAKGNGISRVVFDRNGYLYHGRVKAVAEGAREGGLKL